MERSTTSGMRGHATAARDGLCERCYQPGPITDPASGLCFDCAGAVAENGGRGQAVGPEAYWPAPADGSLRLPSPRLHRLAATSA